MEELTNEDKIKELEKNRDTVQKRLNATTDYFFIYGMVRQIEEINFKIKELKPKQP